MKVLGIPNALFKIEMRELQNFGANGRDEVEFLFSANKQVPPQEISKIASGGELSRLMLSIKSLLSDSLELPDDGLFFGPFNRFFKRNSEVHFF